MPWKRFNQVNSNSRKIKMEMRSNYRTLYNVQFSINRKETQYLYSIRKRFLWRLMVIKNLEAQKNDRIVRNYVKSYKLVTKSLQPDYIYEKNFKKNKIRS